MSLDFAGFIPAIAGLAVGAAGLVMNLYERRRRGRMRVETATIYSTVQSSSRLDVGDHGTMEIRPADRKTGYRMQSGIVPGDLAGAFVGDVVLYHGVDDDVLDGGPGKDIVFESEWLVRGASPAKR